MNQAKDLFELLCYIIACIFFLVSMLFIIRKNMYQLNRRKQRREADIEDIRDVVNNIHYLMNKKNGSEIDADIDREIEENRVLNSSPGLSTLKAMLDDINTNYPIPENLEIAMDYAKKVITEIQNNKGMQQTLGNKMQLMCLYAKKGELEAFIHASFLKKADS